jgi:hypothetical protein
MIHGKTKIELYNPNTKIKNVIKSENTFQSAVLAKQLNTYGEFALGNWHNYTDLVGGLLLFKNAIEVGNRFMPAGNKMIGHGYRGSVTQGAYSFLGTFNSSESSASASAITQVYDFATNQANGTIGCICLTSLKGGQIGYGFNGDKYANLELGTLTGAGIGLVGAQGGYYKGHRYYISGVSEGILSIQKTPVNVEKGNIFRGLSKYITFDLSEVGNHMSAPFEPYWIMMGDCGNGIFRWCCPAVGNGVSVESGGTIYYYEFDAENETLTEKSFTNNTGTTLVLGNYGIQFRGDKCFIANGANYGATSVNVYAIDMSDGSLLHTFTQMANYARYEGVYAPPLVPNELSDNLFILIQTTGYPVLYDPVADETYNMNLRTNSSDTWGRGGMTQMRSVDGILKSFDRTEGNNYVGKNPLYLATINNLQSPVTKTAAQTMKVTYTLTEA